MNTGRLKLRIEDADDLAVLASVLQDAIVPVSDMAFLPEESRFVLVANRFCWEAAREGSKGTFERVNCGITFESTTAVRSRGIEAGDGGMLNLLTVGVEDSAILLVFAGGGAIRLEVEDIKGHMEDLGEPWPTQSRPHHAEAE